MQLNSASAYYERLKFHLDIIKEISLQDILYARSRIFFKAL